MAYSTETDITNQIDEAVLVELTDDEAIGVVDSDRVTRAIADADEEIDGYVGSRHTVPLDPVPAVVRKLSVDIAIYNLYARRVDEVPPVRQKRYDGAIRLLEQIAKGTISLGADDPEGTPPDSDAPEVSSDNPDRTFTRDTMKGF
jgi:phage gp36-like protein